MGEFYIDKTTVTNNEIDSLVADQQLNGFFSTMLTSPSAAVS